MKTTHERVNQTGNERMDVHRISIEGRKEEFDLLIDAFASHADERVQKLSAYIRRAVSK
jgi:hypothetical protein